MSCIIVHEVSIFINVKHEYGLESTYDIPVRKAEIGCADLEKVLAEIVKEARNVGADISLLIEGRNSFIMRIHLLKGANNLAIDHKFEVRG